VEPSLPAGTSVEPVEPKSPVSVLPKSVLPVPVSTGVVPGGAGGAISTPSAGVKSILEVKPSWNFGPARTTLQDAVSSLLSGTPVRITPVLVEKVFTQSFA
jgi:hypothetical protein